MDFKGFRDEIKKVELVRQPNPNNVNNPEVGNGKLPS